MPTSSKSPIPSNTTNSNETNLNHLRQQNVLVIVHAPSMNVPVFLDMVQKLRNVVMKDAPLGTGQRKPIRLAAMMDVPTLL